MKIVTFLAVLLISCRLCPGQPPENGDICFGLNGGYMPVKPYGDAVGIWNLGGPRDSG